MFIKTSGSFQVNPPSPQPMPSHFETNLRMLLNEK